MLVYQRVFGLLLDQNLRFGCLLPRKTLSVWFCHSLDLDWIVVDTYFCKLVGTQVARHRMFSMLWLKSTSMTLSSQLPSCVVFCCQKLSFVISTTASLITFGHLYWYSNVSSLLANKPGIPSFFAKELDLLLYLVRYFNSIVQIIVA